MFLPRILVAHRHRFVSSNYCKFQINRFYSNLPNHEHFLMPDIRLDENTTCDLKLTEWFKKNGDFIGEEDPFLEVDASGVPFTLVNQDSGYLAKILIQEGTENVPAGEPLCIIVQNKEDVAVFQDNTAIDSMKTPIV